MYRVKASYKYQAEDVDELAFEVGEVINVVEYEDPEDQVSKVKDTNRKIRQTEFIYICGSKNGSSSSTVNTGEV